MDAISMNALAEAEHHTTGSLDRPAPAHGRSRLPCASLLYLANRANKDATVIN